MERPIDKSNYYSSLTPEFKFTTSCTIKTSSPFIYMALQPAKKLRYKPKDTECEVMEDGA